MISPLSSVSPESKLGENVVVDSFSIIFEDVIIGDGTRIHPNVTIYQGTMGHGKKGTISKDIDILFTVITRLELSKIKSEIIKIDPAAFFFMQSVKDLRGGIIKKRPLKHD